MRPLLFLRPAMVASTIAVQELKALAQCAAGQVAID